jgi:uroporphyrinogen-III synthase
MQGRRPLEGVRVVVTRAAEQCAELSDKLRAQGALPVEWPLIALAPPLDSGPLDAAIRRLVHFDWIVFSSANGVKFFCARPGAAAWPGLLCVAAVGSQTAAALQSRGWPVDAMPQEFLAASLAETMGELDGMQVLVVHPAIASHELAEALVARGAWVTEVAAYRNVPALPAQRLDLALVDVVTLASASAAANFAARLGGQHHLRPIRGAGRQDRMADRAGGQPPAGPCIATIGPSTSAAARRAGLPVHVEAPVHTLDGLVAALADYFTREEKP